MQNGSSLIAARWRRISAGRWRAPFSSETATTRQEKGKENEKDSAPFRKLDMELHTVYNHAHSSSFFLSILKSCNEIKSLHHTLTLLSLLTIRGISLTSLLSDYLVVSLAKCGAMEDSLSLFWKLSRRTVFSWTALIAAYADSGQGGKAVQMYECMQQDDIQPNNYTYVSLLKSCALVRDIEMGKKFHCDLKSRGFESDHFVRNTLVSMYGKFGMVSHAKDLFSSMRHHDVVSWTAIISAFLEVGDGEKALLSYRQMHKENIIPNLTTFTVSFQVCGKIAETLDIDENLRECMDLENMDEDGCVTSSMCLETMIMDGNLMNSLCLESIDIGGKLTKSTSRENFDVDGSLKKSMHLGNPDVDGSLRKCMDLENFRVNRSITKSVCLEMGRAFHADAYRRFGTLNALVYNTLVIMYAKCGAIAEAENIFGIVSQPHIVSWNALLSAYVQQNDAIRALQFYKRLHLEGFAPEMHTTVFALQACGILADSDEGVMANGHLVKEMGLEIGKQLHVDICKKGCTSDLFVSTALLVMYSKFGILLEAENVFMSLTERDIACWNAMLSVYIYHGQGAMALKLYRQMQGEGVNPNCSTFIISLQACSNLVEKGEDCIFEEVSSQISPLDIVYALHVDALRKGYASNVQFCNTLVSVYGKCNAIEEAEKVFCGLSQHTIVAWTALISAYVDICEGTNALMLYQQMQERNVSPNELTFIAALQACISLVDMSEEEYLVKEMNVKDILKEIVNALYADADKKGYTSCTPVATTFVRAYSKCGCIEEAEHMLVSFPATNVDLHDIALSLYISNGQGNKALQLYSHMVKKLARVSYITVLYMLQACSEMGQLDTCLQLHSYAVCGGYDSVLSLSTSLIHAYGSFASMSDAHAIFDIIPSPQLSMWTSCIAGYARAGNSLLTLFMLENLCLTGLKPNKVTLTSVLSACSRAGLVMGGIEYFHSLSRDSGICPTLTHYSILLDLFGRAGDFKRVTDLVEHMPKEPNLMTWLCLLGACRLHDNLDLGKRAFHHAINLEPMKAVAYVLMSNICARDNNLQTSGENRIHA